MAVARIGKGSRGRPHGVSAPSVYQLPTERTTTWTTGVIGGIPARATIYTTIAAATYAGVDASSGIQTALDACPSGQTVLLGPGTFICDNYVLVPSNVTLRGSGAGVTTLYKSDGARERTSRFVPVNPSDYTYDARPIVIIGPNRYPTYDSTTSKNLTVDGDKGAYTVTVSDASGFSANEIVKLDELSGASWQATPDNFPDDALVWQGDRVAWNMHLPQQVFQDDCQFSDATGPYQDTGGGRVDPDAMSWFSRFDRPTCEIKKIASKAGNVITFTTPLHISYRTSHTAQLTRYVSPNVHTVASGVEKLTVIGGSDGAVRFTHTAGSWAKNIEVTQWIGEGVAIDACWNIELRDSYIHEGSWPTPGGAGYCISLAHGSSEVLIEHCVIYDACKVMVFRSSGAGSVVGYNYTDDAWISYDLTWQEVGLNASHMSGPHHVLFEGSYGQNFDSDYTHGNAIYLTIFRNHLAGQRDSFTDSSVPRCAGLAYGSWWDSFVGNVLGISGGMSGWSYEVAAMAGGNATWSGKNVWMLGYDPERFDMYVDPVTLSTVIRDGNWDHLNSVQTWHTSSATTIPNSLYLSSAPSFFGSLTWPWVNPSTGVTTSLPAKVRFDNHMPNDTRVPVNIAAGTTIQTVVDANAAGTSYVLGAGTHRHQTVQLKDGDALTGTGDLETIMSGAAVLSSPTGSNPWAYTGQTQAGTYVDGIGTACTVGHDRCGYPEDLFFDDVALEHVATFAEGGTGKWFFNYATDTIYIWDNPSGHVVETSITPAAITVGSATGCSIRNLIIEKYATPVDTAAVTYGTDWIIEDCEIRLNHYAGLNTQGTVSTARRNYVHHNQCFGFMGAGASALIEDNEIAYNNADDVFNAFWGAGGSKWVYTGDLVVRGNFSHHNIGPGFWLDINNIDYLFEDNDIEDNHRAGIFCEIGYGGIIRNNRINRNGNTIFGSFSSEGGIGITDCPDVEIYGNTLIDNKFGIGGYEDSRSTATAINTHGYWSLENMYVHDNVIYDIGDIGYSGGIMESYDGGAFSGPNNNVWENNHYHLGAGANHFTWSAGALNNAGWLAVPQDVGATFGTALAAVTWGSGDTHGGTSSAINTIGASVLVVALSSYQGVARPSLTDSGDNVWTALTDRSVSGDMRMTMFFAMNPTVSATHAFTVDTSGLSAYPSFVAAAFSGVATVSPLDDQDGSNTSGAATSLATSSVSPTSNNQTIVTGIALHANATSPTIGSSFTVVDSIAGNPAFRYGTAMAVLVQTTAGAVNPTWSWTTSGAAAAAIGTFEP